MAILNRAQLDDIKLRTKQVEVPEWGGSVVIREMTGAERDEYEASIFGDTAPAKGKDRKLNLANARARLVGYHLVDENNQRLYKANEVYLLGKLPAAGLDRLYEECRVFSGITDEDEKAIQEAVKNLATDQNDASGLG